MIRLQRFFASTIHLVWLPLAAYVIAEVVLAKLASRPMKVDLRCDFVPWGEPALRLQLLALAPLFFLFAIGAICKFVWDLFTVFDRESRSNVLTVCGICIIATFILSQSGSLIELPTLLNADLLEEILDKKADDVWNWKSFDSLRSVASLFVGFALVGLAAGTISCAEQINGLSEQENWNLQSDRLKAYVYLSAGFLVIGVLYYRAWTAYPAWAFKEQHLEGYSALVNSVTMFSGIQFTVTLCAAALPVAMILSRRANGIAEKILKKRENLPEASTVSRFNSEVRAIRAQEKLEFSSGDLVRMLTALLSPLVTGAIPSLSAALG